MGRMKKAEAGLTGAAAVDAYLAEVPEPAQTTLEKVRAAIRAAAPAGTTETIWYGMPTFMTTGVVASYAAFKGHCSYFPASGRVVEELAEELKGYTTAKGTIQFALDKPLPAKLVRKLVKAKLAQLVERELHSKAPKQR